MRTVMILQKITRTFFLWLLIQKILDLNAIDEIIDSIFLQISNIIKLYVTILIKKKKLKIVIVNHKD